jgi:cytochrome c2
LHWGPSFEENRYEMTHAEYKSTESLSNGMHTYGLIWSEDRLMTYIDSEENVVLDVDMRDESFWSRGGFEGLNP